MTLPPRLRKAIFALAITGIAGAALLPFAVYFIGLALAPPMPVPATTHVPPLFADALWARVNGGRASTMRPLNPLTLGHFAGCLAVADLTGDGQVRNIETGACAEVMPAMEGVGYLSRLYLRDEGFPAGSIKYPFGQIATMTWLTRSWTKAELIATLSSRSEFGFGWRGAEAASRGYFGKPLAEVTLPQAAMLAAFVGAVGSDGLGMANNWYDPWCAQVRTASMRRNVLEKMRADGVINDAEMEAANRAELGLVDPPPNHKPCE